MPASHQFVFKIKREWANERPETRRYGFQGHLAQKQVFEVRSEPPTAPPWPPRGRGSSRSMATSADIWCHVLQGLYDRASQVFDIPRSAFHLAYAGGEGAEARLDGYDAFLEHVCSGVLSPQGVASAQRDQKGRIVLVFHARRDPQHEPALKSEPAPVATYSQWDEDTARALAQSSNFDRHATAATAEHRALDAAEQGRADVLQEAPSSALKWAPIPVTPVPVRETPSKYPAHPALIQASVAPNYQWSWAGPTFPPPPPSTRLSHLSHRAHVAPASVGYSPSYSIDPPVVASEPEPEPELEQAASPPPVVEAWSGVKVSLNRLTSSIRSVTSPLCL